MASSLRLVAAVVLTVLLPPAALAQQITVTLLGTGCPPPVMNRFGPSTLVEAGGERLLFDAGRGSLQRLGQLGVPCRKWEACFSRTSIQITWSDSLTFG